MFYHLERGLKICEELKKYIYSEVVTLENYQMVEGKFHDLKEVNEKVEKSMWKDFHKDKLWGEPDAHYWFRTSFEVPSKFHGKPVSIQVFTDKEGWDYVINPQFMLYINGEFIQGLDLNHREVLLTKKAESGDRYTFDLHSYTGRTAKNCQLFMKFGLYHSEVESLYYDCYVPLLAAKKLKEGDVKRDEMIEMVNKAINLLDLRRPHSAFFFQSVIKARTYLKENFYTPLEERKDMEDIVATCVGHTHIDVAWWWTVEQTHEKVARSFSTVLQLMEEYPEYIFMSSQPVLYKFLKEDHPHLYGRLKERVAEGRWEPEGAMWVEADCNVTSGESLVRQILHGTRFFQEEFGVKNDVLWLPDVFGYNAALPQILKKSGINYFMTTKISWNQFNKLPCDTFNWKGIDGTEILTHLITTTGPDQEENAHFTTYNGMLHPGAVLGAWQRYQQKILNKDVLICFGYGDGGGGPTKEMLEMGRRMEKALPGIPKTQMGKAKDYFKRLEKQVEQEEFLPQWVGELYLEYHRGTYTSMARNKRSNRKCEFLYQDAEFFNAMAALIGLKYPKEQLYDNWELILTNQFHDILPGSSIKEVYDVTKVEYERLEAEGKGMIQRAQDHLIDCMDIEQDSIVVFNSLSYDRKDIIKIPWQKGSCLSVVNDKGESIPYQIESDYKEHEEVKWLVLQGTDIPSKGYRTFKVLEEVQSPECNENQGLNENVPKRIINKFFEITLNKNGEIVKLLDRRNNQRLFTEEKPANRLVAYEDKPMYFDNWDIDIYYKEKSWILCEDTKISVVEKGPVRTTVCIKKKFMDSPIIQLMHIYEGIPRIDFETYVDWKERQTLLKVEFPTGLHVEEATFDMQFGNMKRPTHNNTSWDMAKFEVCGHKWVDLSQDDYGVSILNDCKYGHDVHGNQINLTLIKSGIEPNETTDQEEHFFTYSLYPHAGGWQQAKTANMAYNLNVPLYGRYVEGKKKNETLANVKNLSNVNSFFRSNKSHIFIETIKRAEDSEHLVIRLYSNENRGSQCKISTSLQIKNLWTCDLMEKNKSVINHDTRAFETYVGPYEIQTFILEIS